MTMYRSTRQPRLGTALAALAIGLGSIAVATPAAALPKAGTYRPSGRVTLSVGQGQLITLPANVADVWTSNADVADVYVNNPKQIHLFGKSFGEATVIATSAGGAVVYATNVMVSQNINSVDDMLKAAMPDSDIHVTTVDAYAADPCRLRSRPPRRPPSPTCSL